MKAIVLDRGTKEKIVYTDVELPELGEDEVKIQLKAAALNHRDEWARQGLYPNLKDGIVMGSDGAGIVVEVGGKISSSWIGKEVIINPANNWGTDEKAQSKEFHIIGIPTNGTLAEFIHVKGDRIHKKPAFLSWYEAAALPLGGLTAYRALLVQGGLLPGQKVLVTGFGGGVAQFAAQFAIAIGAEVYVSSSSNEKINAAISLGAKSGFNYSEKNWTDKALEKTGGFDLVIDSAMGDTVNNLIHVLKPGGRLVFYGATRGNPQEINARKVFWNQIHIIGSTMGSDKNFEDMLSFISTYRIKPLVDQVFSLKDCVNAFDRMKAGMQLGKIVIKIS
ncbi:zinc-binding dehydrogenase [Shivajiella indica]|uniref:Zinc-binding dehydrogenase n=1 Tax=Shivajiella indica TaxID=872115 RepID=A0ABW5B7A4_9BACT